MSAVRLLRWSDRQRMAFEEARDATGPHAAVVSGPVEPTDLERAEALYRHQRLRDESFSCGAIFQDPAWDLMLVLFIAQAKGQVLSVSGACVGARLASSTGLRWLKTLERRQMVTCSRDPLDRRRRLVSLLPHAVEAMRTLLRSL